jgi:hypothetical protein
MRTLIVVSIFSIFANSAVMAQGLKVQPTATTSTTANAPTGINVPGCTYLRNYPGQQSFPVCNEKSIRTILHDNRYGAQNSNGGKGDGSK